jgi:hypothetical protein
VTNFLKFVLYLPLRGSNPKKFGFWIVFGWETKNSKRSKNPRSKPNKYPKPKPNPIFFGFLNSKFS